MGLKDADSIILGIGDLRVFDTNDTFGVRSETNGVLYQPLVNTRSSSAYAIGNHLALGDAREGLLIREGDTEIYFAYGANRASSNAQSMAIGFHDKTEFAFIVEYFVMSEIYTAAKPRVAVRTIVRCSSMSERDNGTLIKTVFNKDVSRKVEITKADKMVFRELMSRAQAMSKAFSRGNLDDLCPLREAKKRGNC